MCGDKACGSCDANKKKDQLYSLAPGYVKTRVMLYSGDGVANADNSIVTFNITKPLNSVVAIDWTNTDIYYQVLAQPCVVSIDQLPNPNYTTAGVGYFAYILGANNVYPRQFAPFAQPPRSYSVITIRLSNSAGALFTSLSPWSIELEFVQKVNN
jgi:hypothetical protein